MAIANPILATWDNDGTMRSYEFTGGSFVQIQSAGGFSDNYSAGLPWNDGPGLAWSKNGLHNLLGRAAASNIMNVSTRDSSLVAKGGANTTAVATSGGGGWHYQPFEDIIFGLSAITGSLNAFAINTDGTVQAPFNYGNITSRFFCSSADGVYYMFCKTFANGGFFIIKRNGYFSGGRIPNISGATSNPALPFEVTMAAFAHVGYTFVVASPVAGRALVGNVVADVASITHELPVPPGTLSKMRMCRDGRRFALSAVSAGVYTTFVYERRGIYYVKTQEISGFGKLLEFSIDGYLLIDAGNRIAYRFDGQDYILLPNAMNNLTTIVGKAALDQGRGDKDGQQSVYDAGLLALVDGTINLSTLKVTLLKSTAVFNAADTTLAEVTNSGADEVTGGAWPAGGVALTGVARSGNLWLTANTVTRTIVDSGFSARYAVIYDTSDGTPILWIDFLEDKAISRDTQLTLTFRDGKLVDYDR